MSRIKYLINKLELQPHPEGGYFRETYRSSGIINGERSEASFTGSRNYSTCIYFLLTSESFSAFHRIKQDEIWHFYEGSPIELHTISDDGKHDVVFIGSDLENGHTPQFVVPAGDWFAARVSGENSYALVGCTVAPGFDFDDFELARRDDLVSNYPEHEDTIKAFTRS